MKVQLTERRSHETEIEVTDGLQEGDEIVTGSYKTLRTLKDQAKVKVDVKKEGK